MYEAPVPVEHNNELAKLTWLVGGIAVICFLIVTSLLKCFCNRQKTLKVDPSIGDKQPSDAIQVGGDEEEAKVAHVDEKN